MTTTATLAPVLFLPLPCVVPPVDELVRIVTPECGHPEQAGQVHFLPCGDTCCTECAAHHQRYDDCTACADFLAEVGE